MSVSISKGNRKLGGIPSFSVPPVATCSHCSECSKKCYALKMSRLYPSVGKAWQGNLDEWRTNPQAVKYAIINTAITSGYFRYFVGGDIVDADFFAMMVEIAGLIPSCRFLAFTKKHEIVNAYIDSHGNLPNNLQVIFSGWGEGLQPCNPHNLPESDVIFKGQEPPKNALICGGNCVDCLCRGVSCWALKKGEKIHFYEH